MNTIIHDQTMSLQCRRHQVATLPSPDICPSVKGNACKPYGRLHVVISDDDPLGSFVFRTTGFNSIRKERNPVILDLLGFSGRFANVDKDEVCSAYIRADYIERRRPMMNWWSGHIQNAATGNLSVAAIKESREKKVVSIR